MLAYIHEYIHTDTYTHKDVRKRDGGAEGPVQKNEEGLVQKNEENPKQKRGKDLCKVDGGAEGL
jgi:hypothetical protein